jgi:hypothetical protein
MVPFAIAISAGILFLLRTLIAFWTETTRAHHSNVQIRSKRVRKLAPFSTTNQPSAMVISDLLRDGAEAANEGDDGKGLRYMTH